MHLLPTFASQGDLSSLLNRIHHCDALELLRRLPDASVDMVLCDLPYGVMSNSWDNIIPIAPMWNELQRVVTSTGTVVLTACEPFATDLRNGARHLYKYDYVWVKEHKITGFAHSRNMPLSAFENCLVFSKGSVAHKGQKRRMTYNPQLTKGKAYTSTGKGATKFGTIAGHRPSSSDKYLNINDGYRFPTDVLRFRFAEGEEKLGHTSQKPMALFNYFIATYSNPNEVVLDMTCGSGTTAVAARNLGRNFIVCDNHLPYVEMARLRLSNTDPFLPTTFKDGTVQLSLFAEQSA